MKSCLNCGVDAPDEATNCAVCGRAFAYVPGGKVSDNSEMPVDTGWKRPDGKVLLACGWTALAVGLLLLLMSFSTGTSSYGEIDPAALAAKWNLLIGGGGLLQIGIFLVIAGTIVRAIWFLPGKDD